MAYDYSKLPKSDIETLARHFSPYVLAYFESEEGKREYEEWEKQQAKKEEE